MCGLRASVRSRNRENAMSWMKGLFAALGVMWVLVLYASCETLGPESNSGEDYSRNHPIKLELNTLYMDFVSCVGGDKTDWKYFNPPGRTRIKVSFAFDEPSAGGTVVVREPAIKEVTRARFVPGARTVIEFDAIEEYYYLEVFCESFESEYSIEVSIP